MVEVRGGNKNINGEGLRVSALENWNCLVQNGRGLGVERPGFYSTDPSCDLGQVTSLFALLHFVFSSWIISSPGYNTGCLSLCVWTVPRTMGSQSPAGPMGPPVIQINYNNITINTLKMGREGDQLGFKTTRMNMQHTDY